jgi:hypothetical protein
MVEKMRQSELTYKITKGANGKRNLHLFSVPFEGQGGFRRRHMGCKVWYYYYDVSGLSNEDADLCKKECEKVFSPHQIQLPTTPYSEMNLWGKNFVRRWLTAYAKEALGKARGKFKGVLPNPEGTSLELDWDIMTNEGKEEKAKMQDEIEAFLLELRSDKQIERKAKESEDLAKLLNYVPMKMKKT